MDGFYVGQKIRIKKEIDTKVGLYFSPKMRDYLGGTLVVVGFDDRDQYIHAGGWYWHPKWIERGVTLK